MHYHLEKKIVVMTLSLLIWQPTNADQQPPIEKIKKRLGNELRLEEEFHSDCIKYTLAFERILKNCLDMRDHNHYKIHVARMKSSIELFEKNIVIIIHAKIEQEADVTKKKALENAALLLTNMLRDLHAICTMLEEYNGASDIFNLADLGNRLLKYKHLLPEDIRKWTLMQWKNALQHRMSCKAVETPKSTHPAHKPEPMDTQESSSNKPEPMDTSE